MICRVLMGAAPSTAAAAAASSSSKQQQQAAAAAVPSQYQQQQQQRQTAATNTTTTTNNNRNNKHSTTKHQAPSTPLKTTSVNTAARTQHGDRWCCRQPAFQASGLATRDGKKADVRFHSSKAQLAPAARPAGGRRAVPVFFFFFLPRRP
jgi:hypothetical protein